MPCSATSSASPQSQRTNPRTPGEERLIIDERCVAEGIEDLQTRCPAMARAANAVETVPLRLSPSGFAGLGRIVAGQQVSTASAAAIWGRVCAAIDPLTPDAFLAASDETLRNAGLSRSKVTTLRGVATACAAGELSDETLQSLSNDDARAQLTALKGIGPWTADVYLMFCLRRADGFAPGDLALQVAAQALLGLDARPTAKQLALEAEKRWQPWRSVAARLLWAYYARSRRSDAGLPT